MQICIININIFLRIYFIFSLPLSNLLMNFRVIIMILFCSFHKQQYPCKKLVIQLKLILIQIQEFAFQALKIKKILFLLFVKTNQLNLLKQILVFKSKIKRFIQFQLIILVNQLI
ncbi:transmembrane protein, putative (macronuclear) [Tetrahymena thermophila SB210]|uniref:Transmembrane protein, putative n=1 Tax=Tetrahymena thermophila (strain SB210) TaxID=312017 RepID=W7XJ15_TETTS|nr:transmembrane protein, putative [Tetrahymena thermophila SB210]EWS75111.1 transmembrane protein, putative [Tetrahymena thermophila SB210]|eukprot:XP_012652349.1 transmembrane protein, putative [Tetrahymena thermophila SB210]